MSSKKDGYVLLFNLHKSFLHMKTCFKYHYIYSTNCMYRLYSTWSSVGRVRVQSDEEIFGCHSEAIHCTVQQPVCIVMYSVLFSKHFLST